MKGKRCCVALLAGVMAASTLAGCGGNTSGNGTGEGGSDTSTGSPAVSASDNLPVDENGNPSPFGKMCIRDRLYAGNCRICGRI